MIKKKSVAATIQSCTKVCQEVYYLHKVKILFSKEIIFSNILLRIKYQIHRRKFSLHGFPINHTEYDIFLK